MATYTNTFGVATELHTYYMNKPEHSTASSPSEGTQDAVDAQLMGDQARVYGDQIRAQEAQAGADTHRMNERLRVDLQRINAQYWARIRRVEREMHEMDEDMWGIDWNMG
ncbi:hypothetical protein SLS64_010163 [Diaporthe eres]|uniref:Uncharacterized protein n=1 Tax=Diaporthe eres TaxID=83184 RepID=A0ABR1P7Z0_DIAER